MWWDSGEAEEGTPLGLELDPEIILKKKKKAKSQKNTTTFKPPPQIVEVFCSPWTPSASLSCSGWGSHYMAFFAMKFKLLNYKLFS